MDSGVSMLPLFYDNYHSLSVSAIRGYRCALAPVLRQSDIDLSTNPYLSSLSRSFVVSCPPHLPRLPAWDLSLVLRSLLHPPYELLWTASQRDVSSKTVFLLAFASGRWISGLHGLSVEVCHSKGWTSMTFSFSPYFLAKTLCPGQHSFNEFTIPALLDFVGEDEVDCLLCPVQVVRVELVGPTMRLPCGIVIEYFYALGEVFLSLISWWAKDWRMIQLIISGPVSFFVLYWW
ncbi:Solute carrier family 22 member 3 [Portunus trituberculatus]|uniref:Solute carrier family 22 member 3 n=1 Tax=Portunus trituberculatus TaxID=210409 RepID=A0A5B7H735_PORTR|nr:Solute carrier family 22 member 3 [Portunus trituberculatus]